jgi:uncharacterized protein
MVQKMALSYQCPICRKPTDSDKDADFPFCSERCRLIDLGAWSREKYVVSEPIFDEEELAEGRRTVILDLGEDSNRKDRR